MYIQIDMNMYENISALYNNLLVINKFEAFIYFNFMNSKMNYY